LASDLPEMLLAQERLVQPRIEEGIRPLRSLTEIPLVTELAAPGDVAGRWAQMELTDRRAVIRAVMTIRVRPAPYRGVRGISQAVERTEIAWRGPEKPGG